MNPTSGGSVDAVVAPRQTVRDFAAGPLQFTAHIRQPRTVSRGQIEVFDGDRAGNSNVVSGEQFVQQRGVELTVESGVPASETTRVVRPPRSMWSPVTLTSKPRSPFNSAHRRERPVDASERRAGDAEIAVSAPQRAGGTRQGDLRRVAQRETDERRRGEYTETHYKGGNTDQNQPPGPQHQFVNSRRNAPGVDIDQAWRRPLPQHTRRRSGSSR